MKVQILESFHIFRSTPDGGEVKEVYPYGITIEVSDEDAENWIAKGIAKAAEKPPVS